MGVVCCVAAFLAPMPASGDPSALPAARIRGPVAVPLATATVFSGSTSTAANGQISA